MGELKGEIGLGTMHDEVGITGLYVAYHTIATYSCLGFCDRHHI